MLDKNLIDVGQLDLLEKAKQRPELWYPTNCLRWRNGGVLEQKWVSNHDGEEWRAVEAVE